MLLLQCGLKLFTSSRVISHPNDLMQRCDNYCHFFDIQELASAHAALKRILTFFYFYFAFVSFREKNGSAAGLPDGIFSNQKYQFG
jgi:hypothetical protein